MQYTVNYNLKKPEGTDIVNIDDLNDNADILDLKLKEVENKADSAPPNSVNDAAIGSRTPDQSLVPASPGTGTLTQLISWLANRIKAITGKTNWWDAPPTTLQAAKTHMDAAAPHSGHETPAGAQAKADAAAGAVLAELDAHLAETATQAHFAKNIAIEDSGARFTSGDVEGALNELFTSVSDGKTVIASSITDMGQAASGSDTFAQLAAKIRDISKDATAGVGDVLAGKTFYQGGVKRTGTIPSKGAATITPGTANQVISAGQYLSGAQTILGSPNLLSENIKRGVDIFGVNGILDYGPYLRPYDLGIENIAIVNGYSQDITGSGSVTKESNRIKFYYSGVGERSVVTDTTVNLTTIKYILVDWEISGSYQPTLYLVASTTKIAGVGTSNAYIMVYDHARNFSILDVSSLSGYFYIRVHLISVDALGGGTGYLHRILLV